MDITVIAGDEELTAWQMTRNDDWSAVVGMTLAANAEPLLSNRSRTSCTRPLVGRRMTTDRYETDHPLLRIVGKMEPVG